jgi:predicted DNA-binding transcriptional regulator AlpA
MQKILKLHHGTGHQGAFGPPCGWIEGQVAQWIKDRIRGGASMAPTLADTEPTRLIRWAEVHKRTGLSRTAVWRLERDGKFPRRVRLMGEAAD